jgi:preprotein translocase subunit SecG
METVLLVVHLMVVSALVGLVLIQRSEGGALGIGGGTNFLASRGTGNVLTRTTTYLAVGFFATSIALTILAKINEGSGSILDTLPPGGVAPAAETGNLLDLIGPLTPEAPPVTPEVPALLPGAATPPAGEVVPPPAAAPADAPPPALFIPGAEAPAAAPPAGEGGAAPPPAAPAPLAVPN